MIHSHRTSPQHPFMLLGVGNRVFLLLAGISSPRGNRYLPNLFEKSIYLLAVLLQDEGRCGGGPSLGGDTAPASCPPHSPQLSLASKRSKCQKEKRIYLFLGLICGVQGGLAGALPLSSVVVVTACCKWERLSSVERCPCCFLASCMERVWRCGEWLWWTTDLRGRLSH